MDPINIAIVSTASIAKDKVIPALNAVSSATIVGLSSRKIEKAEKFASENNAGKGMSHDEVLEDETVHAVYVPLPSGVRNSFMKKAIEKGKHIYSEKPHSGTVSEFGGILACATERRAIYGWNNVVPLSPYKGDGRASQDYGKSTPS